MGKMHKAKRIRNHFFLLQQKRLGKEYAVFECSDTFYNFDSGLATGPDFKFPSLHLEISRCNLTKNKSFVFPQLMFSVITILSKQILKSHV